MKIVREIIFFTLGVLGFVAFLLGVDKMGQYIEVFLFNEASGYFSWIGGILGLTIAWCWIQKKKEKSEEKYTHFKRLFETYKKESKEDHELAEEFAQSQFLSCVEDLFNDK